MSSTNENFFIGARLRQIRKNNDLSQEEFSNKLNISFRGYQNYERGERGISKELIRSLFDQYKVDPIWLLTGEGEIYRNKPETKFEAKLFLNWLNEWWEKSDEKHRNWLEIQIKRCFPEYEEWLTQRENHLK